MGSTLGLKNAYLSIYISHDFIHGCLIYTDHTSEKNYVLNDKSFLPPNLESFSPSDLGDFWFGYFRSLEKAFSWSFLDKPKVSKDSLIINIKKFSHEGEGVLGCRISLLKSNPNYKVIFQALRKLSLDFKIVPVDRNFDESLLKDFSKKLGYDDILLVDLNSRFFKIARIEKEKDESRKNLSQVSRDEYRFLTKKIKWEDIDPLLELLNGSKYKTFLSKHVASNFISNIWGNFLLNPTIRGNSELLEDFIRSYITIQLLSLSSEETKINKDFGVKPVRTLLWICGDLVEIPEFKKLLISVIDGLELRGVFDLAFDKDSRIYNFGKTFCLGEKSEEIILENKLFLPNFVKVLIPDIDLRPDSRKVVFSGTLFNANRVNMDIFAMSSELTEVRIKDPEKMYLEGRFIKNAYLEEYKNLFQIYCFNNGISWEKIILDCRIKPVVYGPDSRANNIKFNMWLASESYS